MRGAGTFKKKTTTPKPTTNKKTQTKKTPQPTFLHKLLPLSATLQYLCAEPGPYIGFSLALTKGYWPLPNLGSAGTGASSTPSPGAAGRAHQKQLKLTRILPEVKVSFGSPSLILFLIFPRQQQAPLCSSEGSQQSPNDPRQRVQKTKSISEKAELRNCCAKCYVCGCLC